MRIALYLSGIIDGSEDGYEYVDISNIVDIDDASCEEILVGECLDYLSQRKDFFAEIVKKVRYGGKIVISGLDLNQVGRQITNGAINTGNVSELVYNKRHSISNVYEVAETLTKSGMHVTSKTISDINYSVIAERGVPNG